jgi:23S rRNA (pseudouridine1915-N3)-methyltransferase
LKLTVIVVGRPGGMLAEAIRDYETRAARYWPIEFVEVRAGRGRDADDVRAAESARLLERVPAGVELFALMRAGGDAWSSTRLARYIGEAGVRGRSGIAFMVGGAFGLSDEVIRRADRRMRLSTLTLPHDIARLVLTEQLYRAGTISKGEPYHKGDG